MNKKFIILLLFFLFSGVSGLIYQVLWLRMLALIFGVTVYAVTTVLASFMAGLALGSLVAGKLVTRVKSPLKVYAVLEIIIGLTAILSLYGLDFVKDLYITYYPFIAENAVATTLVRFCLAFLVLVVPTTFMGATLPLIAETSILKSGNMQRKLSLLYALNTTGAIFGVIAAGFFLIGNVGIKNSFFIAAGINLIIGIVALLLSRGESTTAKTSIQQKQKYRNIFVKREIVLVVFFISGFVSFALEIIWFRVLISFMPVVTYAFSTMLVAVLSGIAFGSYLASLLIHWKINLIRVLSVIIMTAGVLTILTPFGLLISVKTLGVIENLIHYTFYNPLPLIIITSALVIFPVALLFGLAFPLGLAMWIKGKKVGNQVGVFYFVNTTGAILGAILGGFVLLPSLGLQNSLVILASILGLSGLVINFTDPRKARSNRLIIVMAVVVIMVINLLPLDIKAITAKVRYPNEKVLWEREGVQTTVSIHELSNKSIVMYLDGAHQANDSDAMVLVHKEIGELPRLLHPQSKDALVIGLGGGVTAGALSTDQNIQVDVVELSPDVVKGASYFSHVNQKVLERKNVNILIDDGRNYLLLKNKKYDIVTADIIPPRNAGAGNMYSKEYFELVRDVLKEDGIAVQWIGNGSKTQYKLLARTFLEVFPHVTVWSNGTLLVGSKKPIDSSTFNSEVKSRLVADDKSFREFVGEGAILTDDQPRVEYYMFALPRDEEDIDLTPLLQGKKGL